MCELPGEPARVDVMVLIFTGGGHRLPVEQPASPAEAIGEFLAAIARPEANAGS